MRLPSEKLRRQFSGQRVIRLLRLTTTTKAIQFAETHSEPIHLLLDRCHHAAYEWGSVVKRLKAPMPHLTAIFASGYGGDELAKQLSIATDAVLLSKAFSKTSLLALVQAVLH
jgi:hypothetical protein